MSQSSFPKAEHVAALHEHILQKASESGLELEVADAGLDRYRCQYRLRLKCQATDWSEEIAVHFQAAENLLAGKSVEALERQLAEVFRQCRSAMEG